MKGDATRLMLARASVRRFTDEPIDRQIIEEIFRAGQQAPFTAQMYSFVVTTDEQKRERASAVLGAMVRRAPVFALVCVDFRKLEKFIAYRGRHNLSDNLGMLFLGIQDASYAAQNVVMAAEDAGLGSCFLGAAPFRAEALIDLFKLPERVYPLVGLVIGHPAERPAARPRIPLDNTVFWDEYRDLDDADVAAAMAIMDAGMIREGYYQHLNAKIPLRQGEDKVSYEDYGWSEHMSRKYGEHGVAKTAGLREYLRRQGIGVDE